MTPHEAEVFIDMGGLVVETDARFEVDSDWDGDHLEGCSAILTEWFCNDIWHGRDKLVRIVGKAPVEREEKRIAAEWAETAEADRADAVADYKHDWAAE